MRTRIVTSILFAATLGSIPAVAQTFTNPDPVLERIWQEGMESSHAYGLAQALLDSIGPRLTGSPGHEAGNEWLAQTYGKWGVDARVDPYGEWMRWQNGRTHIDLLEPRVRSLEATIMAWSPGTDGDRVRAEVVTLPTVANQSEFEAWLPTVRNKIVAVSYAEPTCRPNDNWEENATEASFARLQEERNVARREWNSRVQSAGHNARSLVAALEAAGAVGVIASRWSNGWGVQKVFAANTTRVPHLDVACEDYGMLSRMAENGQHPVVELFVEAEFMGMGPVSNVIARIPGSELPNEYVMLSAHFDSWHAGTGTTDNGTGTVTMLEAIRILRAAYPNPKRTILVGHWGSEEQGLNGSRAFVAANPDVIAGMQALFNQDNGTGRVVRISGQGLTGGSESLARWLSLVPSEITGHINYTFPGTPSGGGSDHASFICAGAPAFSLGALGWGYGQYTWHTNRDTFDKIVFDDLKNNATLTAMLVYLASEDDERTPRDRRSVMPVNRRTGEEMEWPACRDQRTWESYHAQQTGR